MDSKKESSSNYLEESKREAFEFIVNNFERIEQLENLENVRKRIETQRELANEEVKSVLRTLTSNIKNALSEISLAPSIFKDVHSTVQEINKQAKEFSKFESELANVKTASLNLTNTKKAVTLLDQLSLVPDVIEQTKTHILGSKLLEAHKNIRELENIRDRLHLQHCRSIPNNTNSDNWPLANYFKEVMILKRTLWDKTWEILEDCFFIESPNLVHITSAVRILEREELVDEHWLYKKEELGGFMPSNRPCTYKIKVFKSIKSKIFNDIHSICESFNFRDDEFINLVFKAFRTKILCVLSNAKSKIVKCFPPHYDVISFLAISFYDAIKTEVALIIKNDASETVSRIAVPLLLWEKDFKGPSLFGHADLGKDVLHAVKSFDTLLSNEDRENLLSKYISSLYSSMTDYTSKAVILESKELRSENKRPEIFKNLYQTMLPKLLIQTITSNLDSAGSFGYDVKLRAFRVFLSAIEALVDKYTKAYEVYSDEHFNAAKLVHNKANSASDKEVPPSEEGWAYFSDYTMAVCNNCCQLTDGVVLLCDKIVDESKKQSLENPLSNEEISMRIHSINMSIDALSNTAATMIVRDFVNSMKTAFSFLFTDGWKTNSGDWSNAFFSALNSFSLVLANLNEKTQHFIFIEIEQWVSIEYVKALMHMKLKFKDRAEKTVAVDQMKSDTKMLMEFFNQQISYANEEDMCCNICKLCISVYECRDVSFVRFDLTKINEIYSDFTKEHAQNLLSIRNDMSTEEIKQKINELDYTPRNDVVQKHGVFSNIVPAKDIFAVFK